IYGAKRTAPLVASGPPGTRRTLQALWETCYATAAAQPPPFPLEVLEVAPGENVQIAGRTVRAVQARHMSPPQVALSLRIDDLAFSGDTGAHEGLVELVRGARAFCTECTNLTPGDPRHLSWPELRELMPPLHAGR